ncbi:MAG: 2Fe-2S iron-sulfur cluster binding domain-containing protein [SAR86 cluster bacterium]|uniref:2Fe-2S iron-sulfur cluster binding domain-containing protein n=1 Tax=SAR86 cluster bacterium TaxID=2030880 RepID=A0A973A878_9GAMM|nr:2Fe-2S iron-sulfur cluster binding domain-containing protein [SAR86 cluster bacterium]
MPRIRFTESNGTVHDVDVNEGLTVMEAAVTRMTPGIEGDCGGLCACATCHVYIPDAWLAKCGEAEELETSILDFAYDVQSNSRLSCQIKITQELDGLEVQMPERQY